MGKLTNIADSIADADMRMTAIDGLIRSNSISTKAAWDAFIDGRTDAQIANIMRAYLKAVFKLL